MVCLDVSERGRNTHLFLFSHCGIILQKYREHFNGTVYCSEFNNRGIFTFYSCLSLSQFYHGALENSPVRRIPDTIINS